MPHHGEDFQNELFRRLVEKHKLGPTHLFPEGKLNQDDEGEIRIAIGPSEGKVVIHFGKPVAWIGFDPAQAREIAQSLNDWAAKLEKDKS